MRKLSLLITVIIFGGVLALTAGAQNSISATRVKTFRVIGVACGERTVMKEYLSSSGETILDRTQSFSNYKEAKAHFDDLVNNSEEVLNRSKSSETKNEPKTVILRTKEKYFKYEIISLDGNWIFSTTSPTLELVNEFEKWFEYHKN